MKTITIKSIVAIVAVASITGCATGPDAQTGTVLGGIMGATAGGIVGHQSGRGLEGAAIGGGLGALAGNMFGNASDQRTNSRQMQAAYQQQQPQYYQQPQRPVYYQQPQPTYYQQRTVYQSVPYEEYRPRTYSTTTTVTTTRRVRDNTYYNNW